MVSTKPADTSWQIPETIPEVDHGQKSEKIHTSDLLELVKKEYADFGEVDYS